jgi:hypothetical protein
MLSVLREHDKPWLDPMLTEYREHATREIILGLFLSREFAGPRRQMPHPSDPDGSRKRCPLARVGADWLVGPVFRKMHRGSVDP